MIKTNRQQLISRARGDASATYRQPDGYVENGVFYSRQKPQYGEFLSVIMFAQKKTEYMAGHENEPVYIWQKAPQDAGAGFIISFK